MICAGLPVHHRCTETRQASKLAAATHKVIPFNPGEPQNFVEFDQNFGLAIGDFNQINKPCLTLARDNTKL
jgi:hypothetical protein